MGTDGVVGNIVLVAPDSGKTIGPAGTAITNIAGLPLVAVNSGGFEGIDIGGVEGG